MSSPVVLITGGAGGIGAATAKLCAKQGYPMAINYNKSKQAAHLLCDEITSQGGVALPVCCDVSDQEQVEQMFCKIEKTIGPVDILINNAGKAGQRLFTDITPHEWDEMFEVNCKGMFLCCRRALPNMINRQSGSIVNVSSVWGMGGASCEVHYSAAKAAIIGMTKALAKEVGPSGIRVNCVAPGVIDTPMNDDFSPEDMGTLCAETPLGRIGTPHEVAQSIIYLATAEFVTGQVLSPNGGFVI